MSQTPANYLFLDLETLPTDIEAVRARITLEARFKQPAQNVKKSIKAAWDTTEGVNLRVSEALNKTAVDPLLARPIVAAYACDYEDVQTLWLEPFAEGMAELVAIFNERIGPNTTWVGFNHEGFDLGVLLNSWRRASVTIPFHFPRFLGRYWRGNTYDAMKRVPNANGLGYVSLDTCCEAFGLGSAKKVILNDTPMDGSRVKAAYDAGEKELLIEYCATDVVMLRKLMFVLTDEGAYLDYPPRDDIAVQIERIRKQPDIDENARNAQLLSLIRTTGLVPGL